MLLGDLPKGGVPCNTGIREHDVKPTPRPPDLRKKAIEIGEIRAVPLHPGHISPDFPHGRGQLWLPASRDEDVRAFVHEPFRGRQANAAVPPVMRAIFPSSFPIYASPIWRYGARRVAPP